MKTYKIAKGWTIFTYLAAPLVVGFFSWPMIQSVQDGHLSPSAGWLSIALSIGMIVATAIGVMDVYKRRLVIQEDRIISVGLFSRRELMLDEIGGYTVNERHIFVMPTNNRKKRIKISNYIGGYYEILAWLHRRFPDLEERAVKAEEKIILDDEKHGWTKGARMVSLVQARRTSQRIHWAAVIITGWAFIHPAPYQYIMLATMAIPIVAILVAKFSDGLIRLDKVKGSAYPAVIYAILFPSFILFWRAIHDFQFLDLSNLWTHAALLTMALLLLLLIKQQEEISLRRRLDYISIASFSAILFAYSFGTIMHFNCVYDHSATESFTAKVLDKNDSSRKVPAYYFTLSPWGQQSEPSDARVDGDLYKRVAIGDDVAVLCREGRFGIPWFVVTDE